MARLHEKKEKSTAESVKIDFDRYFVRFYSFSLVGHG